ncbi:MAG: hypothetical protein LBB43_05305, partial [Spirochaetaceae bacterium]|nr:hypothetical protein [Spirochaetaceae bacterium]
MVSWIFAALFLLAPLRLYAQEVQVRTSVNSPVVGGRVSILLFIDYPNSQEVRISMPNLGNTMHLDRVRTELRRTLATMPDKKGPFTAVEMVLIPQQTGAITIAPIEIILPGRSLRTESVSFFIHGASAKVPQKPLFTWENIPQTARVGEHIECTLRVSGTFNGSLEDAAFYTALPEQTIYEYHTPTDSERAGGIAARMVLIPLTATTITIAEHEFQYEGQKLLIPGFSLPVSHAFVSAEGSSIAPAALQSTSDPVADGRYESIPQHENQWYFLIGLSLLILILFFQKSRFRWYFVVICAAFIGYSIVML